MEKCLNCGKELKHFEGRRKKIFCGNNCRVKYNRKKGKQETVTILKSEYESLKVLSAKITKVDERPFAQFKIEVNPKIEKEKPTDAPKSQTVNHEIDLMEKIVLCETVAEAEQLKKEISKCLFINDKQKKELLQTLIEKSKRFYND